MPTENNRLANIIAADYGTSVQALLEEAVYDSIVPGICRDCESVADSCEPDARNNWCAGCESNAVESILSLKGLI